MRSRHVNAGRSDGVTVRSRSVDRVGDWLRIRQTTIVRGAEGGIDVLGPSWMLALVNVRRGGIAYARCGSEVAVPWNRFAVFAPPGSILEARLSGCRIDTEAIASDGAVPWDSRSAEAWPVAADVRLPGTLDDLRRQFAERTDTLAIGRDDVRSGIAWKAKRRLDSRFASRMTLESLSREMGTSPAAMSRAFRRAYGMPPSEYRHRLRALAAVHHLTTGGAVVESLAEAGFGDVSQTYRAFRALLCATPGSYARSRIAKT